MSTTTTTAAANTTSAPAAPFCKSPPWSMQNEFVIAIGPDKHCMSFFGTNINSPGLYFYALFMSFFLTFCIEFVGYIRKWFHKNYLGKSKNPPAYLHYVGSLLYGLMLSCSYLAMLVAMLYEIAAFIFLILGFVAGHMLFSVYLPQRELAMKKAAATAAVASQNGEHDKDAPLMMEASPLSTRGGAFLQRSVGGEQDEDDDADAEEMTNGTPCCGGTKRH